MLAVIHASSLDGWSARIAARPTGDAANPATTRAEAPTQARRRQRSALGTEWDREGACPATILRRLATAACEWTAHRNAQRLAVGSGSPSFRVAQLFVLPVVEVDGAAGAAEGAGAEDEAAAGVSLVFAGSLVSEVLDSAADSEEIQNSLMRSRLYTSRRL